MTSTQTVRLTIDLPEQVRDELRALAHKDKRSLKAHMEFILQRHAEAKKDDAA